ncbi:MAG TPA: ATP-binding protein [Agitococcus sp.]|nr:ATP-binding protein [Agitococcus sp.]HMX99946.1 ATP-binding protein [Agitococcus sp.]HMY29069.1 ATP-binding protein [Agitococcus sp.]HNB20519.1 ATP-binding protein [Agitococcus sp.]HNC03387.1 ATP-binding protein [Agitococcus sp.]
MLHQLKLRSKLFLLISSANFILACLLYWFNAVSFSSGFSHYLGQQFLAQQQNLAIALVNHYQQHQGWQNLQAQPEVFFNFARQYAKHSNEHHPPPKPKEHFLPPPPPNHYDDWFGLSILTPQKRNLFTGRPIPKEAALLPLYNQQQLIGYLSYLPQHEQSQQLNQAFKQQQQQSFIISSVSLLVISILIAWLIAQWLNKRLLPLNQATKALSAGDYHYRIPLQSEDELDELAKAINQLAADLAHSLHSRQQWIIDISHELRTPLTILSGELAALLEGIRPLSMQQIESLWQEIKRLSRLVDDLHLLSQADAGSLSYHWQTLDLSECLEHVLFNVDLEFAKKNIDIIFQPNPVFIEGDHQRLQQLWLNLAQNTLRYTDVNGALKIDIVSNNDSVTVIWQDSAPSVPDADLQRLTERLFRVDSSRHRQTGGSGLGLSIVKAIADAHHASLTASHSELGGLCWHISFPKQP